MVQPIADQVSDSFKERLNTPLTSAIQQIITTIGMDKEKNWATAGEITDMVITKLSLTPTEIEKKYVKQQVSSRLNNMVKNGNVATLGRSSRSFKYTCAVQQKTIKKASIIDLGLDAEDLKDPMSGIKRLMAKLDMPALITLQMEVASEMHERHEQSIEDSNSLKQDLFTLQSRETKVVDALREIEGMMAESQEAKEAQPA